jgi:sodium/hydrogen exchanger 8
LISATDPVSTLAVFQSKRVDPHLFYLVFGESVINDAVGLVLFNAFAKFVQRDNGFGEVAVGIFTFLIDFTIAFVGSSVLGVILGILAALLLKYIDMRTTPLLELSLYLLIMYVPYLLAEIMQMSGIVTILFTGIAARRYCVPNLSLSTETNADVFFRLVAHVAEVAIFLELGLSVFALFSGDGNFQWRFILWSILACLIGRAANIYPITILFNRSLREENMFVMNSGQETDEFGHVQMTDLVGEKVNDVDVNELQTRTTMTPDSRIDLKIQWNDAHMLWFSGLRGAVAYACVRSFPDIFGHQTEFVVVTMTIVLVTVFFLGGTTELMLNHLKIDMDVDEDKYMDQCPNVHSSSGMLHTFEKDYVLRYVLRDFQSTRPKMNIGKLRYKAAHSVEASTEYQQHVEVSEIEHLETVQQMQKKNPCTTMDHTVLHSLDCRLDV